MALTSMSLHELAQTVLECVCSALEAVAVDNPEQPGCPARACVVAGTAAWDTCDAPCDGDGAPGQLTVNAFRIYPSTTFPAEDKTVRGTKGCPPSPGAAAELVITLLRCAPGPSGTGCPPSCECLAEAARILHIDATTVYNALLCCLPKTGSGRRGPQFIIGAQRIIGPEGLCVGVEQRVTVALPSCSPCPDGGVS